MNRSVLLITLVTVLAIGGCATFMNFSSSTFFSNFSMEDLVKRNRSPSGMICAKGGMGGMLGITGGAGRKQSSFNKISSFSCHISADTFDEAAFVASLKADVEQEITRSGATIVKRGSADPSRFDFEYSEGDIHGRISFEGTKSANYYSLVAKLDETRESDGN